MPVIIPLGVKSPKHFVMYLIPLWIALIILNIILFKAIFSTVNLIFISLIIITISAYIFGKSYFEKIK